MGNVLPVLGPEPVGVDTGEDDGGDHNAVYLSVFAMREWSTVGHTRWKACARCLCKSNSQQCAIKSGPLYSPLIFQIHLAVFCLLLLIQLFLPISSTQPSTLSPRLPFSSPTANASSPPPISLTRGVGSVLLDSGPLAVEGVVGRALKLRADAGVEAAGGGVAENGERRRGAGGGTEAEHCVVGIAGCGGSGDVVRGCAGSSRKSVLGRSRG